MKSWKKAVLVAVACFLSLIAGRNYNGTDRAVIGSLLTCFGILLVTWMEFPTSDANSR